MRSFLGVINWSTVHKFDTYTLIPVSAINSSLSLYVDLIRILQYMDSAPVLLVHAGMLRFFDLGALILINISP